LSVNISDSTSKSFSELPCNENGSNLFEGELVLEGN
jgi:hypothetical protein